MYMFRDHSVKSTNLYSLQKVIEKYSRWHENYQCTKPGDSRERSFGEVRQITRILATGLQCVKSAFSKWLKRKRDVELRVHKFLVFLIEKES